MRTVTILRRPREACVMSVSPRLEGAPTGSIEDDVSFLPNGLTACGVGDLSPVFFPVGCEVDDFWQMWSVPLFTVESDRDPIATFDAQGILYRYVPVPVPAAAWTTSSVPLHCVTDGYACLLFVCDADASVGEVRAEVCSSSAGGHMMMMTTTMGGPIAGYGEPLEGDDVDPNWRAFPQSRDVVRRREQKLDARRRRSARMLDVDGLLFKLRCKDESVIHEMVADLVEGQFYSLAIQDLLLDPANGGDVCALLVPHFWELAVSMHGNHVAQRMVCVHPQLMDVSGVLGGISEAVLLHTACSRYGCRVIQRITERRLFDERHLCWLKAAAPWLLQYMYGRFAVQVLMDMYPDVALYVLELVRDAQVVVNRWNQGVLADVFEKYATSSSSDDLRGLVQAALSAAMRGLSPCLAFGGILRKKGLCGRGNKRARGPRGSRGSRGSRVEPCCRGGH